MLHPIINSWIKRKKWELFQFQKETFTAYGPRGIPAKFIIDKEGNIRFKSLGFNGNSRALIDELTMMIEMIKAK